LTVLQLLEGLPFWLTPFELPLKLTFKHGVEVNVEVNVDPLC
jgi:hypothetical protein